MKTKTVNPSDDVVSIPRPGKDEMNFAEFPIALLTDRVSKSQKCIEFKNEIFDHKKKKMITRRRIIDGSEKYGLPTATDDAVILALIQLTKQTSNFSQREVDFTRLELIKLLGWADEGRNYERLKLSLIRIANVTYTYEDAWWDNRQKAWVTKVFHILDTVEINDSRFSGRQKCLFPSRITWNEVVFDSFQANFLRDIDFQLCIQLQHPIALRMYRFLGKRFHVRPEWSFDLKEFAYDHICLGKNYEGGTQIARKLRPAITELEKHGFLQPLGDDDRFRKKGRDWTIRFVHKSTVDMVAAENKTQLLDTSESPLIGLLVERGVTPKTATELVASKSADVIRAQLEVFDWKKKQKNNSFDRSPAGFLVASIRGEYTAPLEFIPLAEQERRKTAALGKQREEAEARQVKQQQDAADRAELKAINAYRKTQSPVQLMQLESNAIALAKPDIQNQLTATIDPTFRRFLVNSILDDHIRCILQRQPAEGQMSEQPMATNT